MASKSEFGQLISVLFDEGSSSHDRKLLPRAEIGVLLLLFRETPSQGEFVTLAIGDMAKMIGYATDKSIQDALQSLKERGLIESSGVRGKPHDYKLLLVASQSEEKPALTKRASRKIRVRKRKSAGT